MVASPNASATDEGGTRRRGRWDPASKALVPRASASDGEPDARGRSPVANAAAAYAAAAEHYDELHRQWSAAVERERELKAQRASAASALRDARARLDAELDGLESGETKPRRGGWHRRKKPPAEPDTPAAEAPTSHPV